MASQAPSVSVVMATYNGAKFIGSQLDSICRQSRIPDELIIIDDCSTDETWKIITEYQKKNDWIKLHKNPSNLGHFKTFLTGLSLANGEYVSISDQDDVWEQGKLESMVAIMRKRPKCLLLRSQSRFIDENGAPLRDIRRIGIRALDRSLRKISPGYSRLLDQYGSGYEFLISSRLLNLVSESGLSTNEHYQFHDLLLAHIAIVNNGYLEISDKLNFHRIHRENVTEKLAQAPGWATLTDRITYVSQTRAHRIAALAAYCEKSGLEAALMRVRDYQDHNAARIAILEAAAQERRGTALFKLVAELPRYSSIRAIASDLIGIAKGE